LRVPELRQLRTFVAVAEERNFTRAAERLHLAQQAVSKSVAQLERELGVALLERTTREVRLTAAGAALLHDARDVLASADAAFARAVEVGRGLSGIVHVGVSPALGRDVRQEIVAALRAGAPELSVSVLEVRPGAVEQGLRDRELDLVVAHTSRAGPSVDSAALRPVPVRLYVPEGHRLAARTDPVALRELDGERLLVRSAPGTPFTDLLLNRLAAAGATVRPIESRVTGETAPAELIENDAVTLNPAGVLFPDGVVGLDLAEPVTFPLVVLWAAGAVPPAVTKLRAALSGGA
jgi:DNA-binding transcriptional LysR family regulator